MIQAARKDYGPGGWENAVQVYTQRRRNWADATPWPGQWTNFRGEPRCARCGTTKVDGGSTTGVPSCSGCRRLVDNACEAAS